MKKMVQAVCLMSCIVAANGATIRWSRPLNIRSEKDIINFLPVVQAWNVGGTDYVTVNGISFEPSYNLFDLGTSYWDFAPSNSVPPISENYRLLLTTGNYSGSQLRIGGLTPGKTYTIQIWASDSREPVAVNQRRTILYTEGGPKVELKQSVNDDNTYGQYVIGIFTADAPVQIIFFYGTEQGQKKEKVSIINAIVICEGSIFDS